MASLGGIAGAPSASGAPAVLPTQTPAWTAAAPMPGCVVRPQQAEGPYFVDKQLNRSDIRVDPADGSVRQGTPLRLVLTVSRIASSACEPLSGATVDIWHCDALGVYSDVLDRWGVGADTRGQKFLRGYQVTDGRGHVEFMTIYPGWYRGRTVHIHYKIRINPATERGYELTSQLYFDESVTDLVHTQAPYAAKGRRDVTNNRDGIFRNGGHQLLLQLTKDAQGYAGRFDIGLQIT
jgi:protocatechuate 3,4-dioxygenase beta subunit